MVNLSKNTKPTHVNFTSLVVMACWASTLVPVVTTDAVSCTAQPNLMDQGRTARPENEYGSLCRSYVMNLILPHPRTNATAATQDDTDRHIHKKAALTDDKTSF
eukprot:6465145-Amphidinium_carterae.1